MLAGRVPFEADSTLTILHMQIHTPPPPIPGISTAVKAVLDRALVKNPDERYQTSQEMAIDFYLSIGMAAEAGAIRESYPVIPVPISVPAPTKPEPAIEPEPKEQLESPTKREPKQKPEPPAPKEKREPKPARSRAWIGVGLLSLVCLALLVVGGSRLLAALQSLPQSTETVSPVIPNTGISPSPSEAPGLPSAEGMVEITAGTYEVGKDPADDYHIAPQDISLPNFWIDQYQTTNAQYEQYLAQTGATTPVVWPGEGNHPVRGVTWEQAVAYCGWLNKRLPNEAEWEAAGRGSGPDPQLYPWGDDPTDGGNALNLPSQNTYEVGSQSFNLSPFGVYDMVGNVWEWVGEPYSGLPAGIQILRGGRYGNPQDLAYRLAVAADDAIVQYAGFRCAADQVQ
jgi:formylglycine-generating enzyme required for sulfatase activity